MPYQSDAQRRWAHTATGLKALGGKDKVREWDTASRGKKLPERVKESVEQQARADALVVFGLAKQAVSDDWILSKIRNHAQKLLANPSAQAAQRASQRAANISEQITSRSHRQMMNALPDLSKVVPPSTATSTVSRSTPSHGKGIAMGLGALGLAGAGYGLHRYLSRPKPQEQVSKQACLDAFKVFGLTE